MRDARDESDVRGEVTCETQGRLHLASLKPLQSLALTQNA